MAGVPLLNGFLSKEMFFAETIAAGGDSGLRYALPIVATVAGAFSVAYSLRFIHQVFFGPVSKHLPRIPHEPTRGMLFPSVVLVIACLLVGSMPAVTVGPLLQVSARSILGDSPPGYELAVWHGFTLPLLMSFVALFCGIALYAFLLRTRRTMSRTPLLSRIDAARIFDWLDVALIRNAGALARRLFPPGLQAQLLIIVCAAVGAGSLSLMQTGWSRGAAPATPLDPLFSMLWIGGAACALAAALLAKFHRLAALIMAGVVGLVTCLTFAWFSAPDLALTQITVEVVTLVLILLGLRWLPKRLELPDPRRATPLARVRRTRDLIVAIVGGAGVSALAYAVLTRPGAGILAPYFLANSLEQGGGLNVVNVMLVDFRGFDTLGEITVVGIVAITVYALLRRFRPAPESFSATRDGPGGLAEAAAFARVADPLPSGDLRIPAVLVRLLLPVIGLISVYYLLRGHDAPGGGFVGGLIMATGVIAQYMVGGTIWVESRLRVHPLALIGVGLLAAATAGLGAWALTLPFLSALDLHVPVPLLGDIHLTSVLLFDLGVYLLVVGATLLILVALAHQSLRRPGRAPMPAGTD
jgi:multicomponent K+:H+ antiporter subunit A